MPRKRYVPGHSHLQALIGITLMLSCCFFKELRKAMSCVQRNLGLLEDAGFCLPCRMPEFATPCYHDALGTEPDSGSHCSMFHICSV